MVEREKKASKQQQQQQRAEGYENWNISLILDTYDDIFSDFDPRHVSERTVSEDFLEACRKGAADKSDKGLEIRLMMPSKLRDELTEGIIKDRLKRHFHKHYERLLRKEQETKRKGFLWFGIGIVLTISAGIADTGTSFLSHVLVVTLEPASWFLFWTGLETIFKDAKEKAADVEFYRKMSGAEMEFFSY